MIPKGSQGVGHLAARIAFDLIPKAPDAYMAADLGMLAALVGMVGQDFDRAAQVLVSDLEAANAIFRQARPHISDGALRARLDAALAWKPESFAIPILNNQADLAMRALIDLHAAVEDAEAAGAAWAGPLNQSIWAFLDDYVAKRAYDSAF